MTHLDKLLIPKIFLHLSFSEVEKKVTFPNRNVMTFCFIESLNNFSESVQMVCCSNELVQINSFADS